MAVPEFDNWTYSSPLDGPVGYSAASFAGALYRAAGLFDPLLELNMQEFTVRDLYHLDFFNTTHTRPSACQEADPHLSYCQLLGRHRIVISAREISSVKPYSRMNERCPTVGPEYSRPEGC
jgi:hypothetical protein